jgi:hypothetical protein
MPMVNLSNTEEAARQRLKHALERGPDKPEYTAFLQAGWTTLRTQ